MAKQNWAQHYSNDEKTIFDKGIWSLTEDGEKIWSLYLRGQCVEPVLGCNQYKLFDNGFLLYNESDNSHLYALIKEDEPKPIFKYKGVNSSFTIENNLIIFHTNDGDEVFDLTTFSKIFLTKENQLGFEF